MLEIFEKIQKKGCLFQRFVNSIVAYSRGLIRNIISPQ